MSNKLDERLELLRRVAGAWPDFGPEAPTVTARRIASGDLHPIDETIAPLITSSFASGDLLSTYEGVSETISYDENRDRLVFRDLSGETLQARFIEEDGYLRLSGLKTQCAVCFGEPHEICGACDGGGWV